MTKKITLIVVLMWAVFAFGCSGTLRSDSSEHSKDSRSDKKDSDKKDKNKDRDRDDDDDEDDGDSGDKDKDKDKKKDKDKDDDQGDKASTIGTPPPATGQCNKDLWQKVYKAERLAVKADCTTVTGTIAERSTSDDGDEHMLLKLDAGQEGLLTAKNKEKKDGNLVIEAVCVNKTSLEKVGGTCNGFNNQVNLPSVGDHVSVTGTFVVDSHNGWTEIHPITSVEKK